MPKELGLTFQKRLDLAEVRLSKVGEQEGAQPAKAGGWLRKEVLGHLLDSAANNHQRFVRAALDGHYDGPGYEQERWVSLHGYSELSWAELVASWRERNAVLARIVARIEEPLLKAPCKIGNNDPVTLQYLIEDYLRHLDHHVDQIAGTPKS